MLVIQSTQNPLGKRPFAFYGSRYGMSGLGDAAGPQSPSGSVLFYSVTWSPTIGLVSPDMVVSALANKLPNYGMSVRSSQIVAGGWTIGLTGGSITVQVGDTIGHALLGDAQSVLDALVRQVVGADNFDGSTIALVSAPGVGGGSPPPNLSTLGSWLQSNAAVVGIGIAAVVLGTTWLKNR